MTTETTCPDCGWQWYAPQSNVGGTYCPACFNAAGDPDLRHAREAADVLARTAAGQRWLLQAIGGAVDATNTAYQAGVNGVALDLWASLFELAGVAGPVDDLARTCLDRVFAADARLWRPSYERLGLVALGLDTAGPLDDARRAGHDAAERDLQPRAGEPRRCANPTALAERAGFAGVTAEAYVAAYEEHAAFVAGLHGAPVPAEYVA